MPAVPQIVPADPIDPTVPAVPIALCAPDPELSGVDEAPPPEGPDVAKVAEQPVVPLPTHDAVPWQLPGGVALAWAAEPTVAAMPQMVPSEPIVPPARAFPPPELELSGVETAAALPNVPAVPNDPTQPQIDPAVPTEPPEPAVPAATC